MNNVITFTKVSLPYGWLGNMSPFPVVSQGSRYRTTEALFQALRFEEGSEIRDLIRAAKSPMAAKMTAKKHADQMIINPCSVDDVHNMWLCLFLKTEQHPHLKEELFRTRGKTLIEDVTSRNSKGNHLFWGMAFRDGKWVGENNLGKMWMRLRNIIIGD